MKAVRHFATVLAMVLALVATFLITASNTVQADSPDGGVRFFRTPQWYQAQAQAQSSLPIIPGQLNYYGGKVMLTSTTYAIYWAPPGHGIAKGYKKLVNRYFKDIGGSGFYGIDTQYYMNPGANHIKNISTFGGQYVDKTPYPHAGDYNDPLTDRDLRGAIKRAMTAKGWQGGYGSMFFVFTAKGIESCYNSFYCTIGTPHPTYCAYHSSYTSRGQKIIYASMPYAATWATGFQYNCGTKSVTTNGFPDADIEISPTSHEHEEAVTDPDPWGPGDSRTGWVDSSGYENGDKCAYYYGTIASDGHNIVLNGHPYVMQLNWSNADNTCVTE